MIKEKFQEKNNEENKFDDELENIDLIAMEEESDVMRVVITNLSSKNPIVVLVEIEQNLEDRSEMYASLEKEPREMYALLKKYGFVVIDKYDKRNNNGMKHSHSFSKIWDFVFVTLFVLDSKNDSKPKQIYDRRQITDDYLYFNSSNILVSLVDSIPRCDGSNGHILSQFMSGDTGDTCILCLKHKQGSFYRCNQCNASMCQQCCNLIQSGQTVFTLKDGIKCPMTIDKVTNGQVISSKKQFVVTLQCKLSKQWVKKVENVKISNFDLKYEVSAFLCQNSKEKKNTIDLGSIEMKMNNLKENQLVECCFDYSKHEMAFGTKQSEWPKNFVCQVRIVDGVNDVYSRICSPVYLPIG